MKEDLYLSSPSDGVDRATALSVNQCKNQKNVVLTAPAVSAPGNLEGVPEVFEECDAGRLCFKG